MRTLRMKMIVFFLVPTVLIFLIMGFVNYREALGIINPLTENLSSEITQEASSRVGERLRARIEEVGHLANDHRVQSTDWSAMEAYAVEEWETRSHLYEYFYFADTEGNFQATNGEKGYIGDRDYFQAIVNEEKNYAVSDPVISEASGRPSFVIAHPVYDNRGELGGVFAGVVGLDELSAMISNIQFMDDAYGWIIDSSGLVVAHPEEDLAMNFNVLHSDREGYENLEDLGENMLVEPSDSGEFITPDGEEMFSISHQIPNSPGWVLGVIVPQEILRASAANIQTGVIITSILGIIILGGLIAFFATFLSRPLARITNLMEQAEEGNLTIRSPFSGKDEVGRLSRSFNQMLVLIPVQGVG